MIRLPPHVDAIIAILRHGVGDGRSIADGFADIDWELALAFANEELITPELDAAIGRADIADRLPADVRDYLAYIHQLNRSRNERMRRQLIEILQAWNSAGIVPMVLKGGVVLLANGEAMGSRMIADLDLLVDPAEVDTAVQAAEVLGYRRAENYPPEHNAYTCMARPAAPAALDLHREIIVQSRLLPAEAVRRRAILLKQDGVCALVPTPRDQFQHLVLHTMVHHGNHRTGIIWLRGLIDFARMVKAHPSLDWPSMLSELERHGAHNLLRAQAYACRQVFGVSVPKVAAGGPAALLYFWRGAMKWRRYPAGDEPPLLRLCLSGLAYKFDPAERIVPFSEKLVRRLLFGHEPTPIEPA